MSETIIQTIAYPCAEPACDRPATRKVFVTWADRYLARLACDEHVEAARSALLPFVPNGA